MVEDYVRVIEDARRRPAPDVSTLPAHAADAGERTLARLAEPFGVTPALRRDGLLR